jgi:hypothetical protein
MSTVDANGQVTETPREATQADNSKNSFVVLMVPLASAAIVGAALFWYFGMLPGTHSLVF